MFGILVIAELIVVAVLAFMLRGETTPFVLTLIALAGIIAGLAIFFIWTEPANRVTQNWTTIPPNWEQQRDQWEYSHAASAVVALASFVAQTLAAMTTRSPTP